MQILHEIGLNTEFIEALISIPDEIRKIEAIDNNSFKTIKRYNEYHENKNKLTGEENANVGNNIHPSNRYGKMYEPLEKIKSYNLLYIKLREKFSKQRCDAIIKEAIEGSLAINDSENIDLPYCIAFSSTFMMKSGREYIKDVPNVAPTSSESYMKMATEAIFDASSEFMGR